MRPISCTTLLISYGLLLHNRAYSADCDPDVIGIAIVSCQHERETLSEVGQQNNHTQLCQAWQKYSDCMEPKISGCNGDAVIAFRVIKQKYTDEPYNCHKDEDANAHSNDIHGAGEHDENYFDSDYEEVQSHDNHVVTTTQPQQFAGVTVAQLPSELLDNSRLSQPANGTDGVEAEPGVSSSTSHAHSGHSNIFISMVLMALCLVL